MEQNEQVAPAIEPLWGPAELAAYLGYTVGTVKWYVNALPERLPPRVPGLSKARWVPEKVVEWAMRDAPPREAGDPAPAPKKPKIGRPRKVPAH
jgi:hypothetical protein